MAVSSVRVTEGSGPYLHTWQRSISSVNREDQYVQLGEPALPTFTAIASGISTATATSHLMQIMSGSSTYTRILAVELYQDAAAGSTTSSVISLVRLSTAGSTGTTVTPRAMDGGDTANATALTLPSSKGTEGAFLYQRPYLLTATNPSTQVWEWRASDRGKPIVISAGTSQGLCIRNVTGVATATITIVVTFTETAWL
jgi:hypothetical protein